VSAIGVKVRTVPADAVLVAVGVDVCVGVAVGVCVGVLVRVGVPVGVSEAVAVGVDVCIAVCVAVAVEVFVGVLVGGGAPPIKFIEATTSSKARSYVNEAVFSPNCKTPIGLVPKASVRFMIGTLPDQTSI
jgi:hypothetical protein